MLISNAHKKNNKEFLPFHFTSTFIFVFYDDITHVQFLHLIIVPSCLMQPLLHLNKIISSCFEAKSGTQLSGYVLLLVKQEAGVCLKLLFQTTRRRCEWSGGGRRRGVGPDPFTMP